jgi:hypothetical protein
MNDVRAGYRLGDSAKAVRANTAQTVSEENHQREPPDLWHEMAKAFGVRAS